MMKNEEADNVGIGYHIAYCDYCSVNHKENHLKYQQSSKV